MKPIAMNVFNSLALLALLLLASCGGSSGTPGTSVASMGATSVQYGRTITVTVNGSGLTQTELSMRIDGPCVDIAKQPGGTELQLQFTCRINGLGSVVARIRNEDRLEYASLSLDVPSPRVSMSVRQGTRSGTYVVELDPVAAPVTVDNFLAYVNAIPSFYLNTIFHRVVADFVVQAGGFTAVPAVKAPTRAAIVSEAKNGLKNLRGTIAMARLDGADTATAQFFLNLVDNPGLDFGSAENPAGYAVFGKVISGQEIVDEIGIVPVRLNPALGLTHQPETNVVITGATQIR